VIKAVKIDGRIIGPEYPPYIVAEMSANHNGDLKRGFKTIEMAKQMGADAVKLQTYTADTMTIRSQRSEFQIRGGTWDGYDLYRLYEWAQTPFEWHKPLFDHARKMGITCFSTPFDETAVDLLEDLNTPAYKIASFEATDLPLVRYVAQTGKPMIISTGMADFDEITETVETARDNGCNELILLHCVSGYPVPPDQSNLLTIPDLGDSFQVVSGLSDHTLGTTVSVAAIALGASLIEKHVTLSRKDKGADSEFSLEPKELKVLCDQATVAWSALGQAGYQKKSIEEDNIRYRRSIYVVKSVKAGEQFTRENIRRIRPGLGLAPKYYDEIIGCTASKDLEAGIPLEWKDVDQ
jgi:pseudaminic acid synthase